MVDKWSKSETDWLTTDLSNEEIAGKIGRSECAVRKKRYQMTGHYVEDEKKRDKRPEGVIRDIHIDSITKEARIMRLAQIMRIRLMG